MIATLHSARSAALDRLAFSVLVLAVLAVSVGCQPSEPPPSEPPPSEAPPSEAPPSEAPPRSDTITAISQFLVCTGNPYALCYYSGPETAPADSKLPALPCELADDGLTAICKCYAFEDGTTSNYVALPSILNPEVRQETETTCGEDGKKCLNMANQIVCAENPDADHCQTAPVCGYLGDAATGTGQSLYPKGALISTFSFQYALRYPISSTDCSTEPYLRYAGCMTADCTPPYAEYGHQLTDCTCPTYVGPFQFGQSGDDLQCDLGGSNVWSAANLTVSLPDPEDFPD